MSDTYFEVWGSFELLDSEPVAHPRYDKMMLQDITNLLAIENCKAVYVQGFNLSSSHCVIMRNALRSISDKIVFIALQGD